MVHRTASFAASFFYGGPCILAPLIRAAQIGGGLVAMPPPRIFWKLLADRWGLTVPYIWALILVGGCVVCFLFRALGLGREMGPRTRHPYPRLGPVKRVAQIGSGSVATSPSPPGRYGPAVGG